MKEAFHCYSQPHACLIHIGELDINVWLQFLESEKRRRKKHTRCYCCRVLCELESWTNIKKINSVCVKIHFYFFFIWNLIAERHQRKSFVNEWTANTCSPIKCALGRFSIFVYRQIFTNFNRLCCDRLPYASYCWLLPFNRQLPLSNGRIFKGDRWQLWKKWNSLLSDFCLCQRPALKCVYMWSLRLRMLDDLY